MGSIFSVLGPSRTLTWNARARDHYSNYGELFCGMLKENQQYGFWIDAATEYELKLVHGVFSNLHWYFLVRKKVTEGSATLPYVTLEIVTSDMTNLIPVTRDMVDCKQDASDLGVYKGSLSELCKLADNIVLEMKRYDLVHSNCQNFSNKLLRKLGKEEFPTTFSSRTTNANLDESERNFDLFSEVLPDIAYDEQKLRSAKVDSIEIYHPVTTVARIHMPNYSNSRPCEVNGKEVKVVCSLEGPSSVDERDLSMNDYDALLKILTPIDFLWKEIGQNLAFMTHTLKNIETDQQGVNNCLSKMLQKYLQEDPSRSWEKLASAVEDYNDDVAGNIRALAKQAEL